MATTNPQSNPLILSHRLRGFDRHDMTLAGLERAIAKQICMLEVDVRHTLDDSIVLFHDSHFPKFPWGNRVSQLDLSSLRQLARNSDPEYRIATLEEFLYRLQHETHISITIDLKDADLLDTYVDLIHRFGLQKRVGITSWSPQILVDFHQREPNIPLNFSHVSLIGTPTTRRAITYTLARLLSCLNPAAPLTRLLVRINSENAPLPPFAHRGANDIHVLTRPPRGRSLEVLQASGGGIGVFTWSVNPVSLSAWRKNGLKVHAFSIKSPEDLSQFENTGFPDVLFSDHPDLVTKRT